MKKTYPLLFTTIYLVLFCISALSILTSCGSSTKEVYATPKEYDLNKPYKMDMPSNLNEISGIVYYARDTSIFVISDATGWLYKIFLKKNLATQKWKFEKNADYEDVQLIDSSFYILGSSGDIVRVKFHSADSLQVNTFKFPEKGNEFESMYYDTKTGSLTIICKDCDGDKKKIVSSWAFDLKHETYQLSAFAIDVAPIAKSFGLEKMHFKPSAAAVNPVTNELFIVSAINKILVITDTSGQVKEVYALDPSVYKQPEGLAFTPAGDLLISNEANENGYANILILKRKMANK